MEKFVDLISQRVSKAFADAGFDPAFGKVTVSNRPDLCEYQCNGAMPAAKTYKRAPIQIANAVAEQLADDAMFSMVTAVNPGFLNLNVSGQWLRDYVAQMALTDGFGLEQDPNATTIVLDYGGPNVAKPLHVGHLRSAIIGETLKRIFRCFGNTVIGDIHMGDWGLQMGLIIEGVRDRHPELPFFDPDFTGEYPQQVPFTISDLEEIYPAASARSKEDESFSNRAHEATYKLQNGDRGYRAIWQRIMDLSVADLKKNYGNLNVSFDVWLGESDAQPYIPAMIEDMKAKGITEVSNGALVIPVQEESDTKEVPPCILVKSDGAAIYATTDLATIVQRMQDYHPGKLVYLTDKRQALHFEQVFRAAKKAQIVPQNMVLSHIGFGTMNGKDGKPFKTREGGVMRLERLIAEITDYVRQKITENQVVDSSEVEHTARLIAMAALKYGDLSNQPTKDYVFDLERFAAFEGNTGPYILYTIVRIKSILAKYSGSVQPDALMIPETKEAKDLMLVLTRYADSMWQAYRDSAPNAICAYIYELAGAANKFYHETRILAEPDAKKQAGYVALMDLARRVLESSIDLLGFEAPERM